MLEEDSSVVLENPLLVEDVGAEATASLYECNSNPCGERVSIDGFGCVLPLSAPVRQMGVLARCGSW